MDWLQHLINTYPALQSCREEIRSAFALLRDCYRAGGKVLVCGNGGSAADAEHVVGELMKGYMLPRRLPEAERQKLHGDGPAEGEYLASHLQVGLPAISLVSQSALIFAFSNDVAADMVFAQQVYGYGRRGDVLWAISTSGHAANVANALRVAKTIGLATMGMTGPQGGLFNHLCDVTIHAPGSTTPAIQEHHLPIYHTLCAWLEQEFFASDHQQQRAGI